MKEYNATLIDYGEGKGKLVVESKFGKVTFAVKADSHMWVELERPHGEWKKDGYFAVCSNCGSDFPHYDIVSCQLNFCPICGSKNRWKEGDEK